MILDGHGAACDMYHGERDCKSNRLAVQNNTKHRAGSRAIELFVCRRRSVQKWVHPRYFWTDRGREIWPKVRRYIRKQHCSNTGFFVQCYEPYYSNLCGRILSQKRVRSKYGSMYCVAVQTYFYGILVGYLLLNIEPCTKSLGTQGFFFKKKKKR